jgi:hypothetical protein
MYPANAYIIRQASEKDTTTPRHRADLDSQRPFAAAHGARG